MQDDSPPAYVTWSYHPDTPQGCIFASFDIHLWHLINLYELQLNVLIFAFAVSVKSIETTTGSCVSGCIHVITVEGSWPLGPASMDLVKCPVNVNRSCTILQSDC